jgi:hypothetical protein
VSPRERVIWKALGEFVENAECADELTPVEVAELAIARDELARLDALVASPGAATAPACAASSEVSADSVSSRRGSGVVAVRDCWRCHASTTESAACPHCGASSPWATPVAATAPGSPVSVVDT